MSTTQGAFRRSLLPRSIVLASAIVVSTGFLPAVPASAQSLPSIGQLGGSLPGIGDLLGGSIDQSERQLSVTPATDLSDGATVTIKGVGYPANANIYLAQTIEKPKSGYPSTYGEAAKVTVGADGSFTQEMKVATSFGDVDCTSTQCYVASFTAFPNLSDRSNDQWVPITFKAGATSQAAQSQGSTGAAPSGGQSTGSGSQSPSQSRGSALVSLSKTSDLNPSGDTIRVEGKGFKTSGPGIYVGIAQNDQMDVTNADSFGPDTKFVSTSRGNLKSDGSFSVDLPVSAKFGTADCMQNACSVYTIAAHGSSDRSQDTATAVSFAGGAAKQDATLPSGGGSSQSAGSASSSASGSTGSSGSSSTTGSSGSSSSNDSSSSTGTPAVSLSTTELNPSGSTAITVSGTGFKTSGNGIYVAVAEKNKFSTTNADAFSAAEFVRTSQMSSDGSFSTTLNVEAVTSAANCVENDCALYTFAAHGSSDRSQDTATDLSVGGSAKEREEAVKAGASKTGESKASGASKASGKASARSNASGNGLDEAVQTQQAATNSPLQTAAVAGTGAILGALIFGAGILVGRRQKSVD
ncbi:neocarzinostatin apoprotein domain-containing protein [Corynebacterium sp. HMSC14H10]|uniref:neocarzinostatin apoprotein domain-containing protein n=1 Tax=Corynebacterium sp. HMSC14H10 TaxID=1581103 RepID=UPI0009F4588F|nr:neocarzinostatin apoprotein domain-containing protein [Corynebacterium sp. HMSC14H10]